MNSSFSGKKNRKKDEHVRGILVLIILLSTIFLVDYFYSSFNLPRAKSAETQLVPGTDLEVRLDHPRILVTANTLPEIRCRAGIAGYEGNCPQFGSISSVFATFKTYVDQKKASEDAKPDDQLDSNFTQLYAFTFLVTGDNVYCNNAVRRMMYDAGRGDTYFYEGPDSAFTFSPRALAYDWCYTALNSDQKTTIGQNLINVMERYYNTNGRYVDTGYKWLIHAETLALPFAVIFEPGLNDPTNAAVNSMKDHYLAFRDIFIPATNQVMCDGGMDGYGGKRTEWIRITAEIFSLATNYTTMFTDSDFLENSPDFYLSRLRSDANLIKNPGKWNTQSTFLPGYFAQFSRRYNDGYSQWLAEYMVNNNLKTSFFNMTADKRMFPQLILWYDPAIQETNPSSYSKTHYASCSGMNYMRSGWNFGVNGEDIQAGFFNGPDLVESWSQNFFIIGRGDDNLLIRSGLRVDDISLAYHNYYTRSVSGNGISVFDPAQDFGADQYHAGFRLSNDGGQGESDQTEGCNRWPNACTYGYRGEITNFEDLAEEYAYIVGDATYSYSHTSPKTDKVNRSFVYLKPDKFIIFDKVNVSDPSFPARYNIHMIDKPAINGSIQNTIEGNWATGGVFESNDSNLVTVKYGNSALLSKTLLPEMATMRVIGGRNADNDIFKENWIQPGDLFYNSLTHAVTQSYEHWVDGKNYTPQSRNDRPQLFTEDSRYGFNSTPSNESGGWRIEVESTENNFHNFLNVMQVRDGDLNIDDDLDDNDPAFSTVGTWYKAGDDSPRLAWGSFRGDYRYKKNPLATDKVRWNFNVQQAGTYEIFTYLPQNNPASGFPLATNAPYRVNGGMAIRIDQNDRKASWVSLGTFNLIQGPTTIELAGDGVVNGQALMADGMKLVYQNAPLTMVSADLIRSVNDNMMGTLIDGNEAVMFSKSGGNISDSEFTVNALGETKLLLFNLVPSVHYDINVVGQDVSINQTGLGDYLASDQGVLFLIVNLNEGGGLYVNPNSDFLSTGEEGGPFYPPSATYMLTNGSVADLDWAVNANQSWINIFPESGTLLPGESVDIEVSINENANTLPAGSYSDVLDFINFTNGSGNTTRDVLLTVEEPGQLPANPNTDFYYTYVYSQGAWKITGRLQSEKYAKNMLSDGGPDPGILEIGTNLGLANFARGLNGYWNFNETSGATAFDSSGFTNDGTLVNNPLRTEGKVSGALVFNGSNNYVDIGNKNNALNNWTIAVWIKRGTIGTDQAIVDKESWQTGYSLSILPNNHVQFRVLDGTSLPTVESNTALNDLSKWYHVVGVRDNEAGVVRIYINGSEEKNASAGSAPVTSFVNLNIGRSETNSKYFDGVIDDVRVYGKALTNNEIRAIYNATK